MSSNMDENEISRYRAEIIERFINIETIMNTIISQNYFKKVLKDFYFEVLYDEYFGFGLRRRILVKILKRINKHEDHVINELNRLNTIRNYFAHCGTEIIPILPETKEAKIIDPRDIQKEINFKELYAEFMDRANAVETYLFGVYKDLGGKAKTADEI